MNQREDMSIMIQQEAMDELKKIDKRLKIKLKVENYSRKIIGKKT